LRANGGDVDDHAGFGMAEHALNGDAGRFDGVEEVDVEDFVVRGGVVVGPEVGVVLWKELWMRILNGLGKAPRDEGE
jgi:hypothetical protein